MAVKIKFDNTHNIVPPTFVLANRNGNKLGTIPAYDIEYTNDFNSYNILSFKVSKYDNEKKYHLWDKLQNFKLIWCKEYDEWFEISIDLDESNDTVKNIEAKSLSECELSQINLYGIEINTEDDISRDDYIPTILFDSENKNGSLLHRIMEKVPHYKIVHVDASIKNIQRTFSFNGISIYDAFQEIAEEINCIFVFNNGTNHEGKIAREISVYDLESYCLECGHRDEFSYSCPKCGSKNFLTGYGNDTEIFVSVDNLAENIKFSTDVSSVKNCFKLEAGDDLMTATIINCNPNGSGYLWNISEESKLDMSDELVDKLDQYDKLYLYYQNEYTIQISEDILHSYNELIDKYSSINEELKKIPEEIIGYPALMNIYYNTIDMYLYLHDNMMPDSSQQKTTAGFEAAKLNYSSLSPIAVTDLKKASASTVNSAVLTVAKTIVDPRYQVKINNSAYENNIWTGNFVVTNYSDEEDTAVSVQINITINDNYQTYIEQKLKKTLSSEYSDVTNISDLFKLSLSSFITEIKKYCLSRLMSFHDACESCMNILIEQGIANNENWENKNPNLYATLYEPYYQKLLAIEDEIKIRENEIAIVTGLYDIDGNIKKYGIQIIIENEKSSIQDSLNFEKYLGDLWFDFIAYRREDTYSNDNYISDGLNNKQLYDNALEFIETAQKEIYKSANLQHTISASLRNLLAMKEFEPIIDKFEVGNWIRVCVNNNIYKLRLISYTTDYENMDDISVTFSDVKKAMNGLSDMDSVIDQSKSMSSSYSSISRQASQGQKSNQKLQDWVTKGLALTKMKIVDNADNQNITWDSHGLLCREYLPLTDDYDDKQLKIINRGLYLTDNAWKTSKAGIGDFTYYNPQTGEIESSYGVIADTLVGNLILSEKVGIYNTNNSITLDENGLVITNGINTVTINPNSNSLFVLSNKLKDIFSVDDEGNGCFNGTITAINGFIGGWDIGTHSIFSKLNYLGTDYKVSLQAPYEETIIDDNITIRLHNSILSVENLSDNYTPIEITTNKIITKDNDVYSSVMSAGKLEMSYGSEAYCEISGEGIELRSSKSSNYATVSIKQAEIKVDGKEVSVEGHTHSQYSLTSHTHSQYSLTSHTHSYVPLVGDSQINGNINLVGQLTVTDINSGPIYDGATGGSEAKRLVITKYGNFRTEASSSRKYKHDISILSENKLNPEKLLDIDVVQYIYNLDYLDPEDNRYNTLVPGFIAEDVAEKYPIAANYLNGEPEDWNERYIIPPMLKLIQDLHKKVEEIEKELNKLKS